MTNAHETIWGRSVPIIGEAPAHRWVDGATYRSAGLAPSAAAENDQPRLSGPFWLLVHDRPLVHRHDGFRGRWAVAQSTVWSVGVVVFPRPCCANRGLS